MSTDWFNMTSGVRQGCIMSPILFLVAIYWVMHNPFGNQTRGIRWTLYSTLEALEFTEDIAFLASSTNHLQSKTDNLSAKLSNRAHPIHLGN